MLEHEMDFGQVQFMEFPWHLSRKWWDFHRIWSHFRPNCRQKDRRKSMSHFLQGSYRILYRLLTQRKWVLGWYGNFPEAEAEGAKVYYIMMMIIVLWYILLLLLMLCSAPFICCWSGIHSFIQFRRREKIYDVMDFWARSSQYFKLRMVNLV